MAITEELVRVAELTEAEMQRILNGNGKDRRGYERLAEAMEYSVFAGGKRVRPYICVEFCKAFGGSEAAALPYAAAVELMHTASLIHDDLPAMDNDDFRRGKPSNHKQFGEYTAILAGDALIIQSFGSIAGNTGCNGAQNTAAAALLAECAGLDGMCGGQQLDLYIEGRTADIDSVKKTHLLKTAAMIRAAAQLGCIAAGADEAQMKLAGDFATDLGLAFQIRDDILDATASSEELGKTPGKDAASGKGTYVTLAGLDAARAFAQTLTDSAVNAAKTIGGESGDRLLELCAYLLERNN